MNIMNKDEKQRKIRFWIGVIAGIVFVLILSIPEVSPIVDNPRIFEVNPFVYLGTAGIIVGLITGNGIRGGAKAGFLAGIIAVFLMIVKRLIFDSTYNSGPLDPRILLGLLDLIIPLAVPMAAGGAIGGLIGEWIKKLQHSWADRTRI